LTGPLVSGPAPNDRARLPPSRPPRRSTPFPPNRHPTCAALIPSPSRQSFICFPPHLLSHPLSTSSRAAPHLCTGCRRRRAPSRKRHLLPPRARSSSSERASSSSLREPSHRASNAPERPRRTPLPPPRAPSSPAASGPRPVPTPRPRAPPRRLGTRRPNHRLPPPLLRPAADELHRTPRAAVEEHFPVSNPLPRTLKSGPPLRRGVPQPGSPPPRAARDRNRRSPPPAPPGSKAPLLQVACAASPSRTGY
jgi:hypothetical protein